MSPLGLLALLILAFTGHSSGATWCVCKGGLSDAVLQKTLDYACGSGADCSATHQNGACFQPNTVRAHCSYAVNSFFQRKGQAQGTCDFAGTATISTTDPSANGCVYPYSASSATTSTPVTTTPTTATGTATPATGTATPTTGTTTTATPFSATPTGVLGAGVSPTGINDVSDAWFRAQGGSTGTHRWLCFWTTLVLFRGFVPSWWGRG